MRRFLAFFLGISVFLTGCASDNVEVKRKQYTATFLDLFDTVTSITGYADSEEEFQEKAQEIHDSLQIYHQLFDIYHDYEGVANLKTVNDQAGIAPVKVENILIRFLKDCKTYYETTGGRVNVAMGSVLALWHDARSRGRDDPANARLPEDDKLKEADKHTDINALVIDEGASTVYIADPQMSLDVGAIAKGWAANEVSENAPEGLLISVGGNVCATGAKDEKGTPWVVGIQNPDDPEKYLHTIEVTDECVVTSGDYQRTYMVDGKLYHHIIDPETLYPGTYWRSVTIVCKDSGAADALSTALFIMSKEEGQALLDKYDAEALWVDRNGDIQYSPGFKKLIRT